MSMSKNKVLVPSTGYRIFANSQEVRGWLSETLYHQKKHLIGKIFTIIDGVFSDTVQRKAVHDLVNEAFWGDSPVDEGREYVVQTIMSYIDEVDYSKTGQCLEKGEEVAVG